MTHVLVDLTDFGCKDHTFNLANVELIIPGEDFVPMTLPAGTEIKLAHITTCPVCGGRFDGVTLSEEWVIDYEFADDDAIDCLDDVHAKNFLEGNGEPEQLGLGISTEITSGDETEPICEHCGKSLSDFSDVGCGYCDQRSPEWGLAHGT